MLTKLEQLAGQWTPTLPATQHQGFRNTHLSQDLNLGPHAFETRSLSPVSNLPVQEVKIWKDFYLQTFEHHKQKRHSITSFWDKNKKTHSEDE